MEEFAPPAFFDSYYGGVGGGDVNLLDNVPPMTECVDWLFDSFPAPASQGGNGPEGSKKTTGTEQEPAPAFPGFPTLQQHSGTEDSADTTTQGQGRKRKHSLAGSDDSCCDESKHTNLAAKRTKTETIDTHSSGQSKEKSLSLDRKEKNRRSAALSRERKKAAMDSMLLRCKALESTNATLNYLLSMANVEIQTLRRELASLNTGARSTGNKQQSTETEHTGPTNLPAVGVAPCSVPLPCPIPGHAPTQFGITLPPKGANGKIAIPALHPVRRPQCGQPPRPKKKL